MLEFASGVRPDGNCILAAARACNVMGRAAVGPRDQPVKMHGIAGDRGVAGNRRLARTVERRKKRPLTRNSNRRFGVINARETVAYALIARPHLDSNRALPDSG